MDGTQQSVTVRGDVICDPNGCPIELRGTTENITERKRSEDLLRESEERLRLAAQVRKSTPLTGTWTAM
jgi:hypothetical protein